MVYKLQTIQFMEKKKFTISFPDCLIFQRMKDFFWGFLFSPQFLFITFNNFSNNFWLKILSTLGSIQKWRHATRGRGGWLFCDSLSRVVSNIVILAWQRGKGGRKFSKFVWRHLWMPPKSLNKSLNTNILYFGDGMNAA